VYKCTTICRIKLKGKNTRCDMECQQGDKQEKEMFWEVRAKVVDTS